MQAVAYYVELLQYEIVEMTTVEPPFVVEQQDQQTTVPINNKLPVTTKPTTAKPSATTSNPSFSEPSTSSHKPGYFSPQVPIHSVEIEQQVIVPVVTKPTINKPLTGSLPLLSISNTQFFDWFLQMKMKKQTLPSGKINIFFLLISNTLSSF